MDGSVLRIKPRVFDRLRENEDFIAIVRVGRVINVIDHCLQILANPPKFPTDNLLIRHRIRTLFNLAGYLSEGLEVVQSLRLRYPNDDFFEPFLRFFSVEYSGERKLVRTIRNSAFHLDHETKVTRKMLLELKGPHYDFFSQPIIDGEVAGMYFLLADTIDMNYLVDKLSPDGVSRAAMLEMLATIPNFAAKFSAASSAFITGLGKRLKLISSVSTEKA